MLTKRKSFLALVILVVSYGCGLLSCSSANRPTHSSDPVKIGVVYLSQHELISQIVEGFREQLKLEMKDKPYEIIEKHANGDMTALSPTVNGLLSEKLSLIAPISTPVSQVTLKNAPPSVPVMFLGVTDPVGAGIVKSLAEPDLSTGVIDLPPFGKILELIRQLVPKAKSIGFPYSPDEQPAIFSRDQILTLATQYGFTVNAKPVSSADELASVVRSLAKNNDVVLTGADNKMFDQAAQVAKVCLDAHKPFFAGDSTSIKAGAVAGYSVDYRDVGREGAKLAARILNGERAGNIPVKLLTKGNLELNETSAERLGLNLPDEIRKLAKTVYR
jgi:putative ABC transport system substrate-binding protein